MSGYGVMPDRRGVSPCLPNRFTGVLQSFTDCSLCCLGSVRDGAAGSLYSVLYGLARLMSDFFDGTFRLLYRSLLVLILCHQQTERKRNSDQ